MLLGKIAEEVALGHAKPLRARWRAVRLAGLVAIALAGNLLAAGPALAGSPPTVTGVIPSHGAPSGGTEVTITGTNFTGATEVRFGSNEVTSFQVESETKITAVTPAFTGGGEGGVGVYVTTPGGTNNSDECGRPMGFRYEPTITKIEPRSGPAGGGTNVTIRGAAFEGIVAGGGDLCSLLEPVVQSVKFGSKEATHWNVVSPSEITAVAPPGAGTVDVTVQGPVGTSPIVSDDQFSYGPEEPKTETATTVTSTSAILEGTLEPAGTNLKYKFENSEGASCEGGVITAEAEGENKVSAKVEGLTPNTEYTFCLLVKSIEGGVVVGKPEKFKTPVSQVEREGKERLEREANAKAEAEVKDKAEAEAKAKAEAEAATAAAVKKRQEEEAAVASAKKKEEAAAASNVLITIIKVKVSTSSVTVTLKVSQAGTVTIFGPGLKTTRKSVVAGIQVKVALTKAGKRDREHHKKVKITVELKAAGKTVSGSKTLRL